MKQSKSNPHLEKAAAAWSSPDETDAAQLAQDEAAMRNMPSLRQSPFRPFAAGVFTGLIVSALVTFGLLRKDILTQYDFLTSEAEQSILIPPVDVVAAKALLPEITQAVRRLQNILETDPESIEVPNSKGFFTAQSIWPEEYQKLSSEARRGLWFVVRRDGSAYKILLASEFCPVFTATGEFEKDPVRTRSKVLCEYFSVWNAGGEFF